MIREVMIPLEWECRVESGFGQEDNAFCFEHVELAVSLGA